MRFSTYKQGSRSIVYDAGFIQQPGAHLFSAQSWERSGKLVGQAPGRGSALFLETDFGPAVLRHYLRGGQAARFSRDRYLYTGLEHSRPIAEFQLLAGLFKKGLPVPRPLAAQCVRNGLFYTGDLMTRRLADVIPLADLPENQQSDPAMWLAVGACIRQFHEHGVVHADLNARNILVDGKNAVFLIDFDRARIRAGAHRLFAMNLKRLQRSLRKFRQAGVLETAWQQLLMGYRMDAVAPSNREQGERTEHHSGESR
jgi:3-deoxy-D-manno-octulosonic acid kinase